ncbi:unnamed protein product [Musa hybrid cultivar]
MPIAIISFTSNHLLPTIKPTEGRISVSTCAPSMAQEASETSVASSSVSANSRWEIHDDFPSTWSAINQWPQSSHRSISSSCDEGLCISNSSSFTNTYLSGERVENQLWNQVLLNVGSGGDMHNHHGDGDNFLQTLTSKGPSRRNQMSNPACDYPKKLDTNFDFPNPLSLNTFEKHLSSYNGSTNQDEGTPQLDQHIAPSPWSSPMTPFMVQYSTSRITPVKHELPTSPSYPGNKSVRERSTSYKPPYGRNIEGESEHRDMEAPTAFPPPPSNNGFGYQFGVSSLSDLISFGDCVNRPSTELRPSRSYLRGSDSSYGRIQGHDGSSSREHGKSTGTTEGKKKRSDENSQTQLKKSKHENSTVSSLQAPKVKMTDKITSLQQLVSPFGKTDTASVLFETINCIKVLQEQVQLLSNSYMKSSRIKDHSSWGEMNKKEKAEAEADLRSKGLCLVPVSCVPQVHQQSRGPEYWMHAFRSSLFR